MRYTVATAFLILILTLFSAPPNCGQPVVDNYDNRWYLCGGALFVEAAQSPGKFLDTHLTGVKSIAVDDFGLVWAGGAKFLKAHDPRAVDKGWLDFSASLKAPLEGLRLTPSGRIIEFPELLELDADPKGVPQNFGWMSHWEVATLLPGSNHDLSGDTWNGKFWFSGGQTAEWGYPATRHIFDGIYTLSRGKIQTVGKLKAPRYYNGTSHLDGKIWIIAGSRRDEAWQAHDLKTVEIFDPVTHTVTDGPDLPVPLEMVVAQNIHGRIYAAGAPMRGELQLFSIGAGEKSWRREPDPPRGRTNIAGTSLGNNLYVIIPGNGLADFDTAARTWSVIKMDAVPRSAQITAYLGEIWMAGGRDIPSSTQTTIYNPNTETFRKGPDLPRELSWGAAATVDGELYLIGGAGGRCYSNKVFGLITSSP